MFVLFPLWWLLGPGEAVWIGLAAVMVFYLARHGHVEVPRGFGIWLLFLVWMACSVVGIDTGGRLLGFLYRALLYLTVTVVFVYVYNARSRLTVRYVAGVLTVFWLIVVAGGYLGVLVPLFTVHTPFGLLFSPTISSNELVQEMVVRRVSQYNPTGWLKLDPRPSAPFLYTNGWGNAYSMLTPIVVGYLVLVRRERRFWWLLLAIPVSFVPAFLTLNRGMFIGLGLAVVYVSVRAIARGSLKAILMVAGLVMLVAVAFAVLPIEQRLTDRVEMSSSTQDRASLYAETFTRTLDSPLFGYGAPRPSASPYIPAAGTQGQVWMVMFSHGFPAVILFMGWLVWAFCASFRARDPVRVACNTVLLVVIVESAYYGIMATGLSLAMIAAALTMRPGSDRAPETQAELSSVRRLH
ncbi:O-antigen ligase family protein [Leifsonia sp. YAF41]|uniref:O-antigen ligase family protein n=1 Tax=Leifsonia sp. YAF41 TaxID=3233086 RepID=UPI003F9AFB09